MKGERTQQEAFESLRADYQAAKASRFKRKRNVPAMGSGADYHYRNDADFLRIMEYARDMERNDMIVGPLLNQAVTNIVQLGLTPDPATGDPGLNAAIKARWSDWAGDARQCSVDGELVYRDMEKLVMRRMFADGDNMTILTDDGGAGGEGALQLMEAHRCRSTARTERNCVHGVLMDEQRKRLEYWFTKEDIDPMAQVKFYSDITPVDAFATDEATGEIYRQVLHLRNPMRFTQTRGVSAFAPIFDALGMHEDLNFAKLVQQQVASCIAIIRNRSDQWKGGGGGVDAYGRQYTETWDAARRLVEELAPGMELRGQPGETISGFSPNVPNAEFFQQMRQILQLIGINLGIPLVLLMMDASDTNFSGWRGAMDAARLGFKDMQQHLIDHWERPIYLWKLRQWATRDPAMRKAMKKSVLARSEDGSGAVGLVPALFAHEWHAPRWPYIQPLQDAQADDMRQKKLLASPRRIHTALNSDWDDTVAETIEDNGSAIKQAMEKAAELGGGVTWRDVLFMTDPDMLKASTAAGSLAAPAADASVDTTPAETPEDRVQAFLQKLVLQLAGNSLTAPVIANALVIAGEDGIVAGAGAPADPEAADPYLPVTVPAGQLTVTGGVVKDADGDVVGGAAEAGTVESTGGAEVKKEEPAKNAEGGTLNAENVAGGKTQEGPEGADGDETTKTPEGDAKTPNGGKP